MATVQGSSQRREVPLEAGAGSPVLVGRDAELRSLLDALKRLPSLVLVEGEGGVGKTRLVREALAGSRRRVLSGGAQPLREPLPLAPIVEAVRGLGPDLARLRLSPLAGAIAPLLPELADHLPTPPHPLGDAATERYRLFRGLREILLAAGDTILVVEDLHWADDVTADFIQFLWSDPPPNLALVMTLRPEDVPAVLSVRRLASRPPAGATKVLVTLTPFDADGVRGLVKAILAVDEVGDEFASYLHERCGGLPFAVEEMLRLLRERDDLVRRNGRWVRRSLGAMPVPSGIRDMVLERLSHLPGDATAIIHAASVLEDATPLDVLSKVAGLPAARAVKALAAAVGSGILEETGRAAFAFHHDLGRQAVYESISHPVRASMHGRAATALRGAHPLPVGRLARHCREAGRTNKWVRYAEAAADVAIREGNDRAAAEFLFEVASLPGLSPASRCRIAVKLGTAALDAVLHERAVPVLREVLERESLTPGQRGEIRRLLGLLLQQSGQVSGACREYATAVTELARRPRLQALTMKHLGVPWVLEGSLDEHLSWMRRAESAAERSGDATVRFIVRMDHATTLLDAGDPRGWELIAGLPRAPESLEERRQLTRGLRNLADSCYHLGHYARAETFLSDAIRLSEDMDYRRLEHSHEVMRLLLDWVNGRWEGLAERARESMGGPEGHWSGDAAVVAGLLALARGETAEAEGILRWTVERTRNSGAIPVMAMASAGLARLELSRKDPDAAVQEATRSLDVVRAKGIWVWASEVAPVAVEALLLSGAGSEAATLVREFEAGIRTRDAPAARTALATCKAVIAQEEQDHDLAARRHEVARRSWTKLHRPLEAARSLRGKATSTLAAGRAAEAGELLLAAFEELEALGATLEASQVRELLRREGTTISHRRGRKGYGDELSPRQREIVALVASGRRNRDIAAELFLSRRTVEFHVGVAMRKLGVSSRASLAVAVAGPGQGGPEKD